MRPRCRALLVVVALAPPASAADLLEETRACLAENVPSHSTRMELELRSDGPGGGFTHKGRLYWEESEQGLSRTRLCMTSPRDVRGLSYLLHERRPKDGSVDGVPEQTVWVYLPEEERSIRLNPKSAARRGRLARTAAHYRDLRYLPVNLSGVGPGPAEVTVFEGETVTAVLLDLPPGEQNDYGRIASYIDQTRCVPLRMEFHGPDGDPLKVVTADPASVTREGPIWIARSITIKDLKQGLTTEFRVESIEVDPALPDRIFTAGSMTGQCPD